MAKNLKGITIQIGANTKQLNDALKEVDKQVYGLNGDLKALDKALKLDPKNTELLAQKQDVLKRNIEATTQRLNTLKEAQRQMGDYTSLTDEQKTKYNQLSAEITKAEKALKDMNSELSNSNKIDLSKVTNALKKVGDVALQVAKKIAKISLAFAGAIAGIVAAGVKSFGEYEQQLGGIEALFDKTTKKGKEAFEMVEKTGKTAWKDLTLSTTDYYKEFTKTYTLVKNSIPNTEKAIKTTNRMIQLESDLSNTFGYDITTASNAINWALKGSFNYIDNLNLGIKGTKTGFLEAARECGYLVKSVDELTSDQILNVLEQYAKKFGVLGRTEKEAADTIQGSIKSLKAAWDNFINGSGNVEDLLKAFKNVAKNISKVVKELAPKLRDGIIYLVNEAIKELPSILKNALPKLLKAAFDLINQMVETINKNTKPLIDLAITLLNNIVTFITQNLPILLKAALEIILSLAKGITDMLQNSDFIGSIIGVVLDIVTIILDNLDKVVDAGINVMLALREGLIEKGIPVLIAKAPSIILSLISALIKLFPKLLTLGWQILGRIVKGIINALPKIIDIGKDILDKLGEMVSNIWEDIKNIGSQILSGIIDGIKNAPAKIWNGLKGAGKGIVNKLKGFLGIHSPSTMARDEIGYWFGAGINEGIIDGLDATRKQVNLAMTQLGNGIDTSVNPTINPTANTNPLILQIENFYNNRDTDIQKLAEELEFYRKRSATAKGGN